MGCVSIAFAQSQQRNGGLTQKAGIQVSLNRASAEGRNDSSTSGRFPEANLQRRLSGDESEEPSVAARPEVADRVSRARTAGVRAEEPSAGMAHGQDLGLLDPMPLS